MTTQPFTLYHLPAVAESNKPLDCLEELISYPIASSNRIAAITTEPINVVMMLEQAHHPKAGGIVLFSGEVRDHHAGKDVVYLVYEAHVLLAEKMIGEIVRTAKERWNLSHVAAVHRIGKLEISESAVVVVTSHAHRKQAYEANQYIIDRIKHEAPIWKCEHYADGSYEWSKGCLDKF